MIDEKNLQAETYREKQRIKTHYARVIVGSNPDKPYYGIEYYNPTDGEYQEGFGSYDLKNVLRWLEEEFEIVEQTDHEKALKLEMAIEKLKELKTAGSNLIPSCGERAYVMTKAIAMAINALERQIPKKPVSEDRCPLCGGIVSYYYSPFNIVAVTETKDNFCATCGQAIDWGKSNDERNGD